jgi:hypothetical protein
MATGFVVQNDFAAERYNRTHQARQDWARRWLSASSDLPRHKPAKLPHACLSYEIRGGNLPPCFMLRYVAEDSMSRIWLFIMALLVAGPIVAYQASVENGELEKVMNHGKTATANIKKVEWTI